MVRSGRGVEKRVCQAQYLGCALGHRRITDDVPKCKSLYSINDLAAGRAQQRAKYDCPPLEQPGALKEDRLFLHVSKQGCSKSAHFPLPWKSAAIFDPLNLICFRSFTI
jgi:hypothetical protein